MMSSSGPDKRPLAGPSYALFSFCKLIFLPAAIVLICDALSRQEGGNA